MTCIFWTICSDELSITSITQLAFELLQHEPWSVLLVPLCPDDIYFSLLQQITPSVLNSSLVGLLRFLPSR